MGVTGWSREQDTGSTLLFQHSSGARGDFCFFVPISSVAPTGTRSEEEADQFFKLKEELGAAARLSRTNGDDPCLEGHGILQLPLVANVMLISTGRKADLRPVAAGIGRREADDARERAAADDDDAEYRLAESGEAEATGTGRRETKWEWQAEAVLQETVAEA